MKQVFRCECCGAVYDTGEECLNHEKMHPALLKAYPEAYLRMCPLPTTITAVFENGTKALYELSEVPR